MTKIKAYNMYFKCHFTEGIGYDSSFKLKKSIQKLRFLMVLEKIFIKLI